MPAALVTGAGGRLGRAMAVALSEQGFDVAVHFASSEAGAQETVRMIHEAGQKAVSLRADLLIEDEMEALVGRAADALGQPLSVLVNSASIFEHDVMGELTRESWDRHMDSNLRAPVVLTQAFAAQAPAPMKDDQGEPVAQALVVNLIDQRVRKLTPEFMSYTLAKAALWTFTQTAAQALGANVRVNAIGPGPTLRGGRQSEADFAKQRAATILARGADPDDICAALLYLLNAKSVTGQMIAVDGGQHLAWETPDVLDVE